MKESDKELHELLQKAQKRNQFSLEQHHLDGVRIWDAINWFFRGGKEALVPESVVPIS